LRISLNADNVYTFSNKDYRGFDPSGINADGFQWWNYPIPRNIMLGISVGF
ncbi:MAG: TonB-dependent receptor plug, partial [Bacteroidetes bacterium]|nr:TonB-dependent receptor plug [Bacteroidota bacterium]